MKTIVRFKNSGGVDVDDSADAWGSMMDLISFSAWAVGLLAAAVVVGVAFIISLLVAA